MANKTNSGKSLARKKENRKKPKISFWSKLSVIFVLLIFVLVSARITVSQQTLKHPKRAASSKKIVQNLPKITIQPSPRVTPLSTVAPKPLGFCLFAPVIFYHHVQPQAQAQVKHQTSLSVDNGIFDQQMQYLAGRGYTSITVEQLVNAIRTHTRLPSKPIAITFDDGYADNYDYAYPVLRKYGLKGNLMVATGLLGGSDYLSWGQVEDMQRSGVFYLTDHTWSHYAVNHGSIEKIKFEIETARQQIRDHTGQTVPIFTYPYGNYNGAAIQILQQDGFSGAFTTNPGMYQCESQILALPRTRIGNAPLSAYGL